MNHVGKITWNQGLIDSQQIILEFMSGCLDLNAVSNVILVNTAAL
ncbi:hypothetical protein N5D06_00900 [Acinetobacter sp. GD03873]|nr:MULTISPECIES: hypothetical protein [unclassified Acinetobacter]MDH0885172.1 hypothetical protein [Acinetobacter sp. GD03873]MDH2202090.1 hypothetical protein [Acinetobacter sp. GD03647]